jgi:hypothetical protein
MTPKTEIYRVHYNKWKTPEGDVRFSCYTVGVGYDIANMKITPVKIVKIKEWIHVYFSDGGKHIFCGTNPDVEIFMRPVKKEEPKKEEDGKRA